MFAEFLIFPGNPVIPLWIKIAYSIFIAVLVPVYWKKWGLANFLWFSDIALFVMFAAVWLESSLLATMAGISVLIPETAWNISYFTRLITGKKLLSLTDYMFDNSKSYFLRALSLFHVILPPLIIYCIWKLGFKDEAFFYQCLFGWGILLICYFFTDPAENINQAFGIGSKSQTKIKPGLYLLLIMLLLPVAIYLPTYFLLKLIF